MTDIPIQQEGESDEAYQKRIASNVEYEHIKKTCQECGVLMPYEDIISGRCSNCARKKHAEYQSRYYYAHHDEICASRFAKRDITNAKKAEYRRNNRDKIHEYNVKKYALRKNGEANCIVCGDMFYKSYKEQEICSSCRELRKEALKTKNDYIHTTSGPAHREVLRQVGRLTPEFENYTIHHIDGDKSNNDPNNLLLLTNSDHVKLHAHIVNEWAHHPDMNMAELTRLSLQKYHIETH